MKTGPLKGIVANSKTRVRCVFCGVYIPKANRCIEQHTNGAKHKENIELMDESGIYLRNHMLYCKPCKLELTEEESVTGHIESDEHANWVVTMEDLVDGEFINLEPYLSNDKDEVHCEVCATNLHVTLQNIEAHVNGLNHRNNVSQHLKPLNGILNIENYEVYCKVCDHVFEDTPQAILEHIDDDEEHTEWFSEMENLTQDHDISFENYLVNEFENNAYCNKCNIEITCNPQCIETHVNSETHLSQFN